MDHHGVDVRVSQDLLLAALRDPVASQKGSSRGLVSWAPSRRAFDMRWKAFTRPEVCGRVIPRQAIPSGVSSPMA